MRASNETYEKVAKRCSSYKPTGCGCSCNSTKDEEVSCTTCKHFDNEKYCKLDLYDKIVTSYNI